MQSQNAHDLSWQTEDELPSEKPNRARVLSIAELRERFGVAPPPPTENKIGPPAPNRPRIVWRREDAMAE